MLADISWTQFIIFLAITIIVYYLLIWIIFFKAKLPSGLMTSRFQFPSMNQQDDADEVLSAAQHVMDELRPEFDGKRNKAELLMALQKKLQQFTGWNEPVYQEIISKFIKEQATRICSIRLEQVDIREVWK